MEWTISRGNAVAVVDERGGGLRSLSFAGVDVVDGYPAGERPPGGAGQVLAPWPNRIRDGRYEFAGRPHELGITEAANHNAIHGLVRDLPWQLVAEEPGGVAVGCHLAASPGYPSGLALTTRWSVEDDALRVEHTATNVGQEAAPFGLGVHPYLVVPGCPVDEVVLTVPAEQVLLTDDRGLPRELVPTTESGLDFRRGRQIGAAHLDHAFTGFAGTPSVTLAGSGSELELRLDEAFGWAQVFTGDTLAAPRRRRAVAVEPMTCPADAYNSGTDLVVLDPGQRWHGTWSLHRRPR